MHCQKDTNGLKAYIDIEEGINMKILWIVNMMLPELAKHLGRKSGTSGTWLINLSKELSKVEGIDLAIACVNGDRFIDQTIENIRYFCIPGNGKTMIFYHPEIIKYWDMIEESFCPEIVHFHGTEYTHGISYLRKYKNKKKVLTIQGIIEKTSRYHWGGLSFPILLKYRTLKEWLHFNGMLERKIVSRRNVKFEREYIQNINYVTGRTDWDRFYMESINPEIKYFRCYYDLREEFYSATKWDFSTINRNVIYASTSAQVPMKGGHIVIEALKLVKRSIPDVKVMFLANKCKDGKLVPTSGYTKYICALINKYRLEKNVEFIENQDSKGIINLMTKSHITLVPSAIENASATLREAMHLGAPCIASYRGGMTELLRDGESGFFYDYDQYEFLAGRIIQLLKDEKLACKFSENAILHAAEWHDKELNKSAYIDVYKRIYTGD